MVKRGMNGNTLERSRGTTTNAAIHADELNSVSRLTLVYQVIIQNYVRTTGQLACRCPLRHFLDADALVIPKSAEPVLNLQRMSLVICLWCDGRRRGEVGSGGGGIAIFARVEKAGIGAVVDRFEHLWTDEGAACDNTLE